MGFDTHKPYCSWSASDTSVLFSLLDTQGFVAMTLCCHIAVIMIMIGNNDEIYALWVFLSSWYHVSCTYVHTRPYLIAYVVENTLNCELCGDGHFKCTEVDVRMTYQTTFFIV